MCLHRLCQCVSAFAHTHRAQSSWKASHTSRQGIKRRSTSDGLWLAGPGLVLVRGMLHADDLRMTVDATTPMLRSSCAHRTQSFSDNVTRVPGGDCWAVGDSAWRAGQDLVFVLHDDDWFAAALDLDVVQQLSIVDSAIDRLRIAPHLYAGSPALAALAPGAGSGFRSGLHSRVEPEEGGQAVPAAPAPPARLQARSV